jgi:hypothetical protein
LEHFTREAFQSCAFRTAKQHTHTMSDPALVTLRAVLSRKLNLAERHHNHKAARRLLYHLNRVDTALGIITAN